MRLFLRNEIFNLIFLTWCKTWIKYPFVNAKSVIYISVFLHDTFSILCKQSFLNMVKLMFSFNNPIFVARQRNLKMFHKWTPQALSRIFRIYSIPANISGNQTIWKYLYQNTTVSQEREKLFHKNIFIRFWITLFFSDSFVFSRQI